MQERTRKIVQAILYEVIAVMLVTPVIAWAFNESIGVTGLLAVLMSLIAMSWNYIFNSMFEYWEAQQIQKGRPPQIRLMHAIGFEGGLIVFTVPLIADWFGLTMWAALVTDMSLLIFFFFYAIVFQWCFDKVFGLPESASVMQIPQLNAGQDKVE